MNKFSQVTLAAVKRGRPLDVVVGEHLSLTKQGREFIGLCPFHRDTAPSFAVNPEKDGGVYICRACGKYGDVFTFTMHVRGLTFPAAVRALAEEGGVDLDARQVPALVATYDYQGAAGELLYKIERWEPGRNDKDKDFYPKRPDGRGGWETKKAEHQVPYRLPEVLEAVKAGRIIFVVEGEKCADALAALGLVATTNAGGANASKVWENFAPLFKGARLAVLPDNDSPGRKHAEEVIRHVGTVAAEVRLVELGLQGKGDDVADWLDAGHTRAELEVVTKATKTVSLQEWRQYLTKTRHGDLSATAHNAVLLLQNDPAWDGVVAYEEFSEHLLLMKQPPWHQDYTPLGRSTYPRWIVDADVDLCVMWVERTHGVSIGIDAMGRALQAISHRNSFDAMKEHLGSLTWDGVARLDAFLVQYFGAEDTPYSRAVGARWAISAVARVYQPGCQVDHTMVLVGEQGAGKTTAFKVLAGPDRYLDELPPMQNKDAAIALQGKWIVELSELAAMTKSQLEVVKGFLTRAEDDFRGHFERRNATHKRHCVFGGSTNKPHWLVDASGNRRFWPVACAPVVDVPGLRTARDQLWAEAVVRFRKGERWWFDRKLDAVLLTAALDVQEHHQQVDAWEGLVADYLDGRTSASMEEVLKECLGIEKEKWEDRFSNRVSAIFQRLRWKRAQRRVGGGVGMGPGRRAWVYVPDTPLSPPGGGGGDTGGDRVSAPGDAAVTTVTTVTRDFRASNDMGLQSALDFPSRSNSLSDSGDSGDRAEIPRLNATIAVTTLSPPTPLCSDTQRLIEEAGWPAMDGAE